jgi:hypothetical protein
MEKDSGLYNLNKGYAPQEKKDLMNDNPIAKDASGGRGGSWMSKHSQSKVGGSPAKMVSPLETSGERKDHGHHMQIGSDNSQPAGKRTDTPNEYWRKHQQTSHHKKSPAKMVSPLNDTKVNNAPHKHKLEAPPRRRKQYEKSILKKQ